jgi:hypothetical protein
LNPIDRLYARRVSTLDLEVGAIALGRLASWWLSDEALERLKADPSTRGLIGRTDLLPGEFLVLLERRSESDVLAPAFGIPLIWISESELNAINGDTEVRGEVTKDPPLPQRLDAIAIRARERLVASQPESRHDHIRSMHLRFGMGCPDLSTHNMQWSSAGAAVEAALRCKLAGYNPSHLITATAVVGSFGLESVGGLSAKLNAAQRHRLKTVFVAPQQEFTPNTILASDQSSGTEVRHLTRTGLEKQLADLAGHFDAPPIGAEIPAKFAWYQRTGRQRPHERLPFFATELLPTICTSIRERTRSNCVDTLVLLDTLEFPESALIAATLREANRVIVVQIKPNKESRTTNTTREERYGVMQALRRHLEGVLIESVEISRADRAAEELATQLEGVNTGSVRIGVDLSTGPKDLAFLLFDWHRKHQTPCLGAATYVRFESTPTLSEHSYSLLMISDS